MNYSEGDGRETFSIHEVTFDEKVSLHFKISSQSISLTLLSYLLRVVSANIWKKDSLQGKSFPLSRWTSFVSEKSTALISVNFWTSFQQIKKGENERKTHFPLLKSIFTYYFLQHENCLHVVVVDVSFEDVEISDIISFRKLKLILSSFNWRVQQLLKL